MDNILYFHRICHFGIFSIVSLQSRCPLTRLWEFWCLFTIAPNRDWRLTYLILASLGIVTSNEAHAAYNTIFFELASCECILHLTKYHVCTSSLFCLQNLFPNMPAKDELSDDYVASLLAKDAKTSNGKYSTYGLQELLPRRCSQIIRLPMLQG